MQFKNEAEKRKFISVLLNKGRQAAIQEYMEGQVIPYLKGQNIELFGETLTPDEVNAKYPGVLLCECTDSETIEHINAIGNERI